MDKIGKRKGREPRERGQLILALRGMAREALWDAVVISGAGVCRGGNGGGARGAVRTALPASR